MVVLTLANGGPVKILDKNPYRLLYSIQNLDAANYITIGPTSTLSAGLYGLQEGQHLAAGQPMSDDTDQAEVWGMADPVGAANVNISVIEISELPREEPKQENPRRAPHYRPEERRELRREARTF